MVVVMMFIMSSSVRTWSMALVGGGNGGGDGDDMDQRTRRRG